MVTGDGVAEPTTPGRLVTVTCTESPPRSCWLSTKFKDEFNRAADTVNAALLPCARVKLCVPGLFGPASTKPDGASVTVPTPLVKPAEVTVKFTMPLLAKPCT